VKGETGAEEMMVYGKPGKRNSCFPPFPQTLEIAGRSNPERKLIPSDFHIPSATATTATMSKFKTRKESSYFA
jgi:hypothetical protein